MKRTACRLPVWMTAWLVLPVLLSAVSGLHQTDAATNSTAAADTPPITLSAFPLQDASHMRWSAPVSTQVWGLPLQYAWFESDWPLERLMAALSREQGHFQLFTRLPEQWLLSGHRADQHWLAQIMVDDAPDARGSRGLVSRWQMSAPDAGQNSALAPFFRTPQLGPPLLHVRSNHQGRVVEHAIFQASVSLTNAAHQIHQPLAQQLERAGWQRQQGVAADTAPFPAASLLSASPALATPLTDQFWRLANRRLMWQVWPHGTGLMVFVQHQEQG